MRKVFNIAIIIVVAILFLLAIVPFVLGGAEGAFNTYRFFFKYFSAPKPPKPMIRRGDFPLTLVYEINGEEKVIEDTLICTYDGVAWAGDFSLGWNAWKERLKSGNKGVIILRLDKESILYYPILGSAYYFMGDGAVRDADYYRVARIDIVEGGHLVTKNVDAEELFSKYGIRIISWEIAPPIVNSFK